MAKKTEGTVEKRITSEQGWNSAGIAEADPSVFRLGTEPDALDKSASEGGTVVEHGEHEGFVNVAEEPNMTTMRDEGSAPKIVHEDPQFLADHQVGSDDEVVATYDVETGGEIAELHKRKRSNR